MFSCLQPRLKWAIGPFRLLVHVLGLPTTIRVYTFSCFQKTDETVGLHVLDRRALDIALTVNILVKHFRSGLPPTMHRWWQYSMLYKLSYLHLGLRYVTLL